MKHEPIIIIGCPRSGTSATTGVLQACGLDLGYPLVPKLKEHKLIRDSVVKGILRMNFQDPKGQSIPDKPIQVDPAELRKQIISLHGSNHQSMWGFKCLKGLLFADQLLSAFPEARYVYCWRDPIKIAQSMQDVSFFSTKPDKYQWIDLIDHYQQKAEWILRNAMHSIKFRPFKDDWKTVVGFCGLKYNQQAVEKWINPDLFRQ